MELVVLYRGRQWFHYDLDWRDAFLNFRDAHVTAFAVDFLDPKMYRAILRADYIVLLHSVDPGHLGRRNKVLARLLMFRKGKLVYFPRNEFRDFVLKREFIRAANVDVVASQLRPPIAEYLYGDLATVVWMPHALNPSIFNCTLAFSQREIMIGGRTAQYPITLLDNARNNVKTIVQQIAVAHPQWNLDYSDDTAQRFDRTGWANFLNQCRFTITSEAGSVHVDKTDCSQVAIEKYAAEHSGITAAELYSVFAPQVQGFPSGKSITSRHFEAMGCKTCQILIEGEYSGLVEPGKHYISLKQDGSNLTQALAQMQDLDLVNQITETAFEFVRSSHTHQHRVRELFKQLAI